MWLLEPGVPMDPDPVGAEARMTLGDVRPGIAPGQALATFEATELLEN